MNTLKIALRITIPHSNIHGKITRLHSNIREKVAFQYSTLMLFTQNHTHKHRNIFYLDRTDYKILLSFSN